MIWERYRKVKNIFFAYSELISVLYCVLLVTSQIKTGGQLKEDIKKKALQRQIKKFRTMVARDEL